MKICHGTSRIVLLIGNYAVKVPSFVEWRLFLLGLLANMQERRFSEHGWEELCPVLWSIYGGFMIVMRRAEPLTREQFDSFDAEAWLERDDYVVPAEPKMDSFGWLDGKIVAIDYGN